MVPCRACGRSAQSAVSYDIIIHATAIMMAETLNTKKSHDFIVILNKSYFGCATYKFNHAVPDRVNVDLDIVSRFFQSELEDGFFYVGK